MEIVWRIFIVLITIVILFLLAKLMGNKQISELTLFDYINGITIGSIAADMSIAEENDIKGPFIAMIIFALCATLISFITNKSLKFRRIAVGKSIILMKNDKLYYNAFKKARLDMNEFLIQCRVKGIFDLSEIEVAVFEPNGSVSILPKTFARPLQVQDMNLSLRQSEIKINVVLDGKIMFENLQQAGLNKEWLMSEIKKQNVNLNEIFIAFCDSQNKLTVYKKDMSKIKNDIFQ